MIVRRVRRASIVPAACLLWATACGDQAGDASPAELVTVHADHITYGVTRNFSREGVREARLLADSMYMWDDSTSVMLIGLTLEVFNENGGQRAVITAEEGRMNADSDELVARGNAVLNIPGDARELRSAELWFVLDRRDNRIWTDSAVVMREGDCQVEGERFQTDFSFEELRIWGTREGECSSR